MQAFNELTAIAAPLPLINIDTDMIIPKQFLKTTKRTGLGANLFDEMRFDSNGNEIADFVLNKEPFRNAQILVTGKNFGCGSSREHAPWALLDFGIKSIIAPSFADIFYNNCFKNGILPISIPQDDVDNILQYIADNNPPVLTINLPKQTITAGNITIEFAIDSFRKKCLLEALDDIAITLQKTKYIDEFEHKQRQTHPWLYSA